MMQIRKIIPFTPYYSSNGNKVIEKWDEGFIDRKGNRAVLTKIRFETYKKGKLQSVNVAVAQVRWLKEEEDFNISEFGYMMSTITQEIVALKKEYCTACDNNASFDEKMYHLNKLKCELAKLHNPNMYTAKAWSD
jgi:hypothetical protein